MTATSARTIACCLMTLILTQCSENQSEKQPWQYGWRESATLLSARSGFALVQHNNFFYVIGGVDGKKYLDTVEFAKIHQNGTISTWKTASRLNQARGFLAAAVIGNTIYVIGGANGDHGETLITQVESAQISDDGSLGPWIVQKHQLNIPRRCARVFKVGNRLIAAGGFGGASLDNVESAMLDKQGQLGPWHVQENKLTEPRYVHAVASVNQQQFVIGGHQQKKGAGLKSVEWRMTGQTWKSTEKMRQARYGLSAVATQNWLYALGGINGVQYMDHIEKAKIGRQGLKPWKQTTTVLPMPLAEMGVIIYGNHIYLIGGSHRFGYSNRTFFTSIDNHGELGFYGPPEQVAKVKKPSASNFPYKGVVVEVLAAQSYVYLKLQQDNHSWWVATQGSFQKGQTLFHGKGVTMTDFFSKGLNRRFDKIIFTSRYQIEQNTP